MCLSRFHKRVCERERRERDGERVRETERLVGVRDRVMRRASEKISHR